MNEPNNVQFSIAAEVELTPDQLPTGSIVAMMSSRERTYMALRPNAAEMTEIVSATYGADGQPDITLHETVSDGADALLVQAFISDINCFPHAPDTSKAIPGPALHRLELKWPVLEANKTFSMAIALERSVLSRARGTCQHCGEPSGRLPTGYNLTPKSIKVQVRLTLSGPVVR